MIDAIEKFFHVHAQIPGPAAQEALRAANRRMRALVAAGGVGVEDEAVLVERLENGHHRVMHDPVAERRHGDGAALGIAHLEKAVRRGPVAAACQLVLQRKEPGLQTI